LQTQIQKKLKKEISATQMLVGGVMYWPTVVKKTETSYQFLPGVQGLAVELAYDATGKRQEQVRKVIRESLKKIGFQAKTYAAGVKCQTAEVNSFSACLDYWERGTEKCVTYVVMEPIERMDLQKVQARLVQLKIWCGESGVSMSSTGRGSGWNK
jgi:hypothetical protein